MTGKIHREKEEITGIVTQAVLTEHLVVIVGVTRDARQLQTKIGVVIYIAHCNEAGRSESSQLYA